MSDLSVPRDWPGNDGTTFPAEERSAPESQIPPPWAFVDAGGESGERLGQAIARRLQSIDHGQVLQVVSLEPAARTEVPAWCREHGQALAATRQNGSETSFWIRKCEPIGDEDLPRSPWIPNPPQS